MSYVSDLISKYNLTLSSDQITIFNEEYKRISNSTDLKKSLTRQLNTVKVHLFVEGIYTYVTECLRIELGRPLNHEEKTFIYKDAKRRLNNRVLTPTTQSINSITNKVLNQISNSMIKTHKDTLKIKEFNRRLVELNMNICNTKKKNSRTK